MYVELTRFHAAMYFSMQPVTHVSSELESEDPGLGTHFSKQVDLRFCVPVLSAFYSLIISLSNWLVAMEGQKVSGSDG